MYFTQEALCKKIRADAFAKNAIGRIQISPVFTKSGIQVSVKLGASPSAHLKMDEYRARFIKIIRTLGVKVLKTYRLGDFVNDDLVSSDFYKSPLFPINEVQSRNDDCCSFIEEKLHAGKYHLDLFLSCYPGKSLYEKAISVPENLKKKFSRLVAEMSDEQSIAIHYANGIDFFCTRDRAGNAGGNSVLSIQNKTKLFDEFSICIISLNDLAKKIKEI